MHLLRHLDHPVELLQPLLGIVRNGVHFTLVHKLLVLVDVLPVDNPVSEDLDPALVVREAGVLPGDGGDHGHQVAALAHLDGKHAAPLRQLEGQLDELITLFPEGGVLAEDLVEVVEDASDAISLVGVLDVHQSKQGSLLALDDHEVADLDDLEYLLNVDVRELAVVGRDVREHACDSVAHHGKLLGCGAPPDAIVHVVD